MNTLKKHQIPILKLLIMSLIISISVAGNLYAGMTNDNKNGKEDNSYMFSPGYINAAKQQTDNIISQNETKKNAWQRAIEYVQTKLSRQADEQANDDESIDLQKRVSAEGVANPAAQQISEGIFETASKFYSIDPNAAAKVLNDSVARGSTVTTLSNGSMVNMWREDNHTYFSVIGSQGEMLVEKRNLTVDGDWNNVYAWNITDIGDGKFATIVYGYKYEYKQNYYSKSDYTYSLQVYSTNDYDAGSLLTQKDYGGHYYYDYKNQSYYGESTSVGSLTSLGSGQYAMSVNQYSYKNDTSGYTYNSDSYVSITDNSLDINRGLRYDLNNSYGGDWNNGDYFYNYQYVNSITSLDNGTFVLAIGDYYYDQKTNDYGDGTLIKVMDSKLDSKSEAYYNGSSYSYTEQDGSYNYDYSYNYLSNVVSLGNGKFATAWSDSSGHSYYDMNTYSYESTSSIYIKEFDSSLRELNQYDIGDFTSSYSSGNYNKWSYGYISDMKVLDNGSLVLAVNESVGEYDYSTKKSTYTNDAAVKVIDSNGAVTDIDLEGSLGEGSNKTVSQLTVLGDGNFAVILRENKTVNETQNVSQDSVKQFSTVNQTTSKKEIDSSISSSKTESSGLSLGYTDTSENSSSSGTKSRSSSTLANAAESTDKISGLKTLSSTDSGSYKEIDSILTGVGENDILSAYSIFQNADRSTIDASMLLKNIFNNPTDDQKKILDAMEGLIADIKKLQKATGNEGLFKEETEELVKAAMAALLAQALPDLIDSASIYNIKGIFSALGAEKGSILKQYEDSTEPYYDQILKDIAKNIDILQMQNIISKNLTKNDLDKMPRSQIDKIIEKLKQQEKRSFEEDYILQQEQKYRTSYIEPSKKVLEERMKTLLKNFTEKINKSLEKVQDKKK